ncbi:hypothetical protein [Cytophaga hutchinsonii]|uniref:Uncharacterized protein n=1 Tax=Cytophaga hutchinsonii (strain ATCC 33406 / DSM 1761 / CIP 103989 / NBRC 15051 / NCIMB 9469 / D465) TaxID=269798 RepID=A0A6N4SPC6_CYTH3|nr:hypothetical protein [Cytophaga hutchinsonii]ABG58098.1 hypothetical protein CHU_0811 [Cytophaga hutchinsonii ATCC 33406]
MDMETNNTKSIKDEVITLLLADMKSRRLLMGLESTGLVTDDYNSNLVDLIFYKLDVSKQHETNMWNWYEDTIYTLLEIDMHYFRVHQEFLAHKLYDAIMEKKNQLVNKLPDTLSTDFYAVLSWLKLNKYNN